jgi:multisubunit Na+/H+ antiporter MnhB subunit
MSTTGYLLLLLLAAIISTQLLMLSSRRKPLAKRLRDLNEGGDAATIGIAVLIMCAALGAFIGHFFDAPAQARQPARPSRCSP